jgi:uncharacterized membrane protein YhhN
LSFLIAHVCYILEFKKQSGNPDRKAIFVLIGLFLYGILLLPLLWNGLGNMKIPVVIYALAILSMVFFAERRITSGKSYFLILGGAIAFVLSDSLIAINRFAISILYADLWIMLTYGLAQLMIIRGIITSKA